MFELVYWLLQTHGKLQDSAAAKQLTGGGIFPFGVLVSTAVPELIPCSWV